MTRGVWSESDQPGTKPSLECSDMGASGSVFRVLEALEQVQVRVGVTLRVSSRMRVRVRDLVVQRVYDQVAKLSGLNHYSIHTHGSSWVRDSEIISYTGL